MLLFIGTVRGVRSDSGGRGGGQLRRAVRAVRRAGSGGRASRPVLRRAARLAPVASSRADGDDRAPVCRRTHCPSPRRVSSASLLPWLDGRMLMCGGGGQRPRRRRSETTKGGRMEKRASGAVGGREWRRTDVRAVVQTGERADWRAGRPAGGRAGERAGGRAARARTNSTARHVAEKIESR